MGATEDGQPRMVTTPWLDHEIPMTEAAELGTKKVMEDHCTAGIVITTDGSVTDIPREDYLDAETRSIQDMQATGKPFLVLVNSTNPQSEQAQNLCQEIAQQYHVTCQAVNCLEMDQGQIQQILQGMLYEFPVQELRFYLPRWVEALDASHEIKQALYEAMRRSAGEISKISEAEPAIREICELEAVQNYSVRPDRSGDRHHQLCFAVPGGVVLQRTQRTVRLRCQKRRRSYRAAGTALVGQTGVRQGGQCPG